jgi:hypothetical protein
VSGKWPAPTYKNSVCIYLFGKLNKHSTFVYIEEGNYTKAVEKRIDYKSRGDVYHLYPISDIHAGTVFCAEDEIRKQVKLIKDDPFALWVGLGDYCEWITPKDKRFDSQAIAGWVKKGDIARSQEQWVIDLLSPIKSKCIGLCTGNHEESIRLQFNTDVHKHLCDALEADNLGYSCFIVLKFKRLHGSVSCFTCHFEHGSGGAQTEGGLTMRLARSIGAFKGNIYGMGHLHTIKIDSIPLLAVTEELKIKSFPRVGAITGCWFRAYYDNNGYPSYAELKGHKPTNIGCPYYDLYPDSKEVEVRGGKIAIG